MNAQSTELPPRPPGAVKALLSGFNAVAGNIGVIVLPAALDLFLWLGPRLTISSLMAPMQAFLQQALASSGQSQPLPKSASDMIAGLNLFSNLRTFPLGIFSLMLFNVSTTSPLGARLVWDIPNVFIAFFIWMLLVALGCLLGCVYFYMVSRAALRPKAGPGLVRGIFHSLVLAGAWQFVLLGAALLVFIPFMLISAWLAGTFWEFAFFLLVAWPLSWVGLLFFFSAHGIFTDSKNAFTSLAQTFQVLRFGMPPMGWFVVMALIISRAMDLLWSSAPTDSWMTLIGILGHAFVSTGLLAASFIYYRDLSAWVEAALQWLSTHQITSARA